MPASQRALPIVCPALRDLEQRELLLVLADEVGEAPQQQAAVGGARRRAHAGAAALARAIASSVSLEARSTRATGRGDDASSSVASG